MNILATGPATLVPGTPSADPNTARLREKATELEATFLAEMLQFAGLGAEQDSFGGGIGEEQFASFLRQEQARLMADRGGIGLAQSLFDALVKQGTHG
jgi:peptidoglycan hydrolase FlgJ